MLENLVWGFRRGAAGRVSDGSLPRLYRLTGCSESLSKSENRDLSG